MMKSPSNTSAGRRPPDDEVVLQAMQRWLEQAVIGLNLCPFARAVHSRGQIRWVVSPARTRQALAEALAGECLHLARSNPADTDTTVLVHPRVLTRFADFLDFLALAEDLLKRLRLRGVLQIASFHPHYRFAGLPARDAGHRTNQAPYPALHLLREDSVARAVASIPDPARIYERNIDTLRNLGDEGWAALFTERPPRHRR